MRVQRILSTLVATLAIALATAPGAAAQLAGQSEGVTASRGADGYVLHFGPKAAALYRKIAGRRVVVTCTEVDRTVRFGLSISGSSSSTVRAARRRGPLATHTAGKADYCSVRLAGSGHATLAAAAVSAAGRTYLDEARTAGLLFVPFAVADSPSGAPPPTDRVVAKGHGLVVALDGPDASPPYSKVGYWTDGQRVVVAAVTATGRRLFYDIDGDVVRTNALPYLRPEG